jgi:hypothetical protein
MCTACARHVHVHNTQTDRQEARSKVSTIICPGSVQPWHQHTHVHAFKKTDTHTQIDGDKTHRKLGAEPCALGLRIGHLLLRLSQLVPEVAVLQRTSMWSHTCALALVFVFILMVRMYAYVYVFTICKYIIYIYVYISYVNVCISCFSTRERVTICVHRYDNRHPGPQRSTRLNSSMFSVRKQKILVITQKCARRHVRVLVCVYSGLAHLLDQCLVCRLFHVSVEFQLGNDHLYSSSRWFTT